MSLTNTYYVAGSGMLFEVLESLEVLWRTCRSYAAQKAFVALKCRGVAGEMEPRGQRL